MFKELDGKQRVDFVNAMITAYGEKNLRGATANQFGSDYRVLVMSDSENQTLTMFGPRYTAWSNDQIIAKETSGTYPGFEVEVARPQLIRVTYHDINGVVNVARLTDDTARVFLNCFDHLQGQSFWAGSSKFHIDRALRKWSIAKRRSKK